MGETRWQQVILYCFMCQEQLVIDKHGATEHLLQLREVYVLCNHRSLSIEIYWHIYCLELVSALQFGA